MTVTVRPLAAGDHGAWLCLWRGYLAFYGCQLADEVSELTWRRLMDAQGPIRGLAAVLDGGALAGFAHYLFHASSWSPAGYCYLEDLFVDPGARGAGAGRALVEAVYQAADEAGATRVYWHTQQDNITARRLYDRLASLSEFVQYRR